MDWQMLELWELQRRWAIISVFVILAMLPIMIAISYLYYWLRDKWDNR